MEAFVSHRGLMAPLDRANVDTDAIIPKQFLKSIKRTGFGPSAFFDWRYVIDGTPDPEFELNKERYNGRSILVTRNNFGCGSSREHAVWALAQDGYKVIIAPHRGEGDEFIPGFADIFKNNCTKNGLVTVELSEDEVEEIMSAVFGTEGLEASVDLEAQTVTVHGETDKVYNFDYDQAVKEKILKGLDDIEETLAYLDDIKAFEETHNVQLG